MKDSSNLHLKVQEFCDCFSTTDPLKEMSKLTKEPNSHEAALKWLALSVLHGVNNNAKEISIRLGDDGIVSVTAEYRETTLPSPGVAVAESIFDTVRQITHIDGDKGKTRLAVGIKDSSLDLAVSVKNKADSKKITIKF